MKRRLRSGESVFGCGEFESGHYINNPYKKLTLYWV